MIDGNAFQLQKDFVHLNERNDKKNLANKKDSADEKNSADNNIQQQLLHNFDDLKNFDENKDDVQVALNF